MNKYFKKTEILRMLDENIDNLLYVQSECWLPDEVNMWNAHIEYLAMVRFNLKNNLLEFLSEKQMDTILLATIDDTRVYIYPKFFDDIDNAYSILRTTIFNN